MSKELMKATIKPAPKANALQDQTKSNQKACEIIKIINYIHTTYGNYSVRGVKQRECSAKE